MPTSRDIQADSRAFDERYGEVRLLRRRQFVGAVSRVTGVPGELLDRVYEDAESEYARAPVEGMAKHAYARACVRSRAMEHLESIGGFGRLLLKHKYIRRIPTGNPKRPWRYIYPEDVKPRAKVEGLDLGFVQESKDKAQLELGLGMPRLPEQHFLDTSPPTVGPVRYDMPLSKVEEVIRREPLEHLVVFDHLTGQQVFRARGSGESVDFGRAKHREWRQHGECVATHNHPCGTVFSDSDLFAAIGADLQEIRAVAPNGGTFVFTRPAQGWGTADGITGDEVRELVDDARDRGMARATSRMDQIIKQAGGKPNEGSRAEGYDQRTWLRLFSEETERAYNEVFRARGLEWQVEHQGTRYLAPVIDDGDGQGMAPALPPRPVHYASGSNRTPDIRGLAYDLGLNVGLVVDEIRDEQFNLLHGLAGKGVKVFVDSGAFGEVRFRQDGPPEVVKPISESDWRAKLDTYKDLARVLGSQLTLVAPDQVGNQAVTLERMRRYREDMYDAVQYGARVLVPVQKGASPMAEFYRAQAEALGYGIGIGDRPEYEGAGYYVPAIPMMKDATSPEQVGEFIAAVQPPEVHLLGMGPSSQKLEKTLDAIRDASPGTVITMDSNLLGSKQGRDRKKSPDNPTGARDFTRVQDEIERRMNMLMGPQVSDDVLRDSVESGNRYAAMSNAMGAPQLAFTRPQLRAIARKAGLQPRSEGGKGLFEKWVESPELWDSPQFHHSSGRTHEQYRAVLRALEDAAYNKYVWPYRSDPGRARQVKKQAAIRQVFGGGGDAAKSFRGIVMGLRKARAVKYIKRVPTGNPRRPWRYIYPGDENKGSSSSDDQLALFDWKPKLRRKSPRDRLEQYRKEVFSPSKRIPEYKLKELASAAIGDVVYAVKREVDFKVSEAEIGLANAKTQEARDDIADEIMRLRSSSVPGPEYATEVVQARANALLRHEAASEKVGELMKLPARLFRGDPVSDLSVADDLMRVAVDDWVSTMGLNTSRQVEAGFLTLHGQYHKSKLEVERLEKIASLSDEPSAFIREFRALLESERHRYYRTDGVRVHPGDRRAREVYESVHKDFDKLSEAMSDSSSDTAEVVEYLRKTVKYAKDWARNRAEQTRAAIEVRTLSGVYREDINDSNGPMHPALAAFYARLDKQVEKDPNLALFRKKARSYGLNYASVGGHILRMRIGPHRELGHWGSANSTNDVAWTTAVYGDSGRMRPLDGGMQLWEIPESYKSDADARRAAKIRYIYAQDQIDKFPRSEHPLMYRGMGLPAEVAENLKEGETIPMTGCTAFTFYYRVARRYMDSAWTQRKSEKDAVPTLITIERTQDFDDSIAGWHHAHSSTDDPAFEIVSGVNALRIKSIKRESGRILITAEGVLEGMETASKGGLSTSFSELLHKARAVKYIKRVPTGNPKRPWRYIYPGDENKGSSSSDDQLALFDWKPKPRRKSPRDRLEQYRKEVFEPEITDELVYAVELVYRKTQEHRLISSQLEEHKGQSPLPPMESLTDLIRAQMEVEREYQMASNALLLHRGTKPRWPVRVKRGSPKGDARETVVGAWEAIAEALEEWASCIFDRESLKRQGVEGAALLELKRQRRKELNQFSKDPDTFLRQSMEVLFGDTEPDPSTSKFLTGDDEIDPLAEDTVNGLYMLKEYRLTDSYTDAYLAAMVPWYVTERQMVSKTKDLVYEKKRLFGGDPSDGSRSKRFQAPMHPKKAKFLRDVKDLAKDDPAFSFQAKETGKYGLLNVPVTSTISNLLNTPEPKLGHWGSANSTNDVAWTTAVYGDSGRMRPLDGGMKLWEIPESYKSDADARRAAKARYVYAQDQIDKFPRSEHPRMYRGMGLPKGVAENLKEGETIPMTGCTAFTFYNRVARRYMDSEWTQGKSEKDAVPTLITIERTQDFDDSIAGWHHAHSSTDDPAFEIVSGINALEVVSIERVNMRIATEARGGSHVKGRSRPDMSDWLDPARIVRGSHDDEFMTRLPMSDWIGPQTGGAPVLVRVPPANPSPEPANPDPNLPGLEVGGLWTIEGAPFAGKKIGEVIQGKDIEPLLHEHYPTAMLIKAKGVLE